MVLHDDLGTPTPITRPANRVVSLVPSLTESVASTRPEALVGATDWCTHPADLDVTRVRGTKNPDVKRIVDLRPELVLANQEENRELDVRRLREAGVPVWVTVVRSVPEAVGSMTRLFEEALGWGTPAWLAEVGAAWGGTVPPARLRVAVPPLLAARPPPARLPVLLAVPPGRLAALFLVLFLVLFAALLLALFRPPAPPRLLDDDFAADARVLLARFRVPAALLEPLAVPRCAVLFFAVLRLAVPRLAAPFAAPRFAVPRFAVPRFAVLFPAALRVPLLRADVFVPPRAVVFDPPRAALFVPPRLDADVLPPAFRAPALRAPAFRAPVLPALRVLVLLPPPPPPLRPPLLRALPPRLPPLRVLLALAPRLAAPPLRALDVLRDDEPEVLRDACVRVAMFRS
jgi:hypothetical protein